MYKLLFIGLLALVLSSKVSGQQNVFSRSEVTTGNWGDGQLPWSYQFDGNQGDPDNGNSTANFVRIGHNNNLSMTLNGRAYQARELIFEAGASSPRSISGNTLEMRTNGGNCKIENYSSANHSFINDIALFATTEINPINGDITIGDINTNNNFIDVYGNNGHTLSITGVVDGTNGLGVQQNSVVNLSGANTYSGGTFINNGRIILSNPSGLGAITGNTTISAGAVLELNSSSNFDAEPLILNGTGVSDGGALIKSNTGTVQFPGDILLNSDSRINVEGGILDYRGDLDVNGNTVYFGGNQNFLFGFGSEILNANKLTGDGAIYKDGSGYLGLRPSSAISGDIYLVEGSIRHYTGTYSSSGTLYFSDGTLYQSSSTANRVVDKSIQIQGDITLGASGGLDGSIEFANSVDLTGGSREINMPNDNEISGAISNGSLIKAGSGSLTLSGSTANSLGPSSSVDDGLLILNKSAGTQATDNITINTSGSVRTDADNQWGIGTPPFIQINGSGSLDLNNTNQSIALASSSATSSITLGSGTLTINNTASDEFLGVISGTGNLVKTNTGEQVLSGNNTYTGYTEISDGILRIGGSERISNSSELRLNGGTFSTGDVSGFSETMDELLLSSNSTISLAPGAHSISFNASNTQIWASNATLTITGWQGSAESAGTEGRIFVGSDDLGLTSVQLAKINFDGFGAGAVILNTGEVVPRDGNFRLLDDFNRTDNVVIGSPDSYPGSWIETENLSGGAANGDYIEILNQHLRLQNCGSGDNDGGNKSAAFDISGLYATTFEEAGGELRWYFNMKQSRTNPSGFGTSLYGVAFIIGANESDFGSSTVDGYAVVQGDGSSDPLRLIHFTDGIPNDPVANTIISVQPNISNKDHFFSIVVTFDPCSETWGMNFRDDGDSGFGNPISLDEPIVFGSDDTHIAESLNFLGGYFTHGTTCTEDALFDNINIPTELAETVSYTWAGGSSGDFQVSTNWTPQRACTKNNDELIFDSGTSINASNVPNELVGSLQIINNTQLRLTDVSSGNSTSILSIRNSSQGLNIESGSELILDVATSSTGNGMEVFLIGSTSGVVDGTLTMINSIDGSGRPHRFQGSDMNSIQVNGSIVIQDLTGEPFGSSVAGSVVFNNGSILEVHDGANPFQLSPPSSVIVFNNGSTYKYLDDQAGLSISGRTYANFEFNTGTTENINFSGTNSWVVQNLSVLSGMLNAQPTGELNIDISGNLFVDVGASLILDPSIESVINFNGNSLQTISGDGTLTFGENQILQFDNSFGGSTKAISLDRDITLRNDLIILNGRVEGTGFELTMAGEDHTIQANDDIFGEFDGNNNEIELVIAENTTLTGSATTCDFYNITVNAGKTLTLQRSVQCLNGTFNVGNSATLLINSGGFVESNGAGYRSPNYGFGSFLIYDIGSDYNRNVEWISDVGSGYPYNVIIRPNTELRTGAFGYVSSPLAVQNDLEIEVNGNLFMDFSDDDMLVPLKIGGDLTLAGVLALSDQNGGDLEVSGNWNHTGIFNGKQRRISFLGSGPQSISSANSLSFAYCTINNTSTEGVSYDGDIAITTELTFTDGIFFGQGTSKIIFEDGSSYLTPSNASHIDGWIRKIGSTDFGFPTGGYYDDPDGTPQNYLQTLRILDLSGTLTFDARYFPETHPDLPGSGFYNGTSQQISGCDYWTLNRITASGGARVAVTYGSTPCNSVTDLNFLGIARWNGLAWDYPMLEGSDPVAVPGEVSTISAVTSFSDFALASEGGFDINVLPIELLSFNAQNIDNKQVLLTWATATEIDNDFFTLERSIDGLNFEIIGTVSGAGNSTSQINYSYVDDDPYSGISYYRLKQTDFDGTFTYSELRAVEILNDGNFGLNKVYASDGGLRLSYNSRNPFLTVDIIDMAGKSIYSETIENQGNSIIFPRLASGIYLLRLSNGQEFATEKFFY